MRRGERGELRRDPMAMLPFCGYHMGDYFAHWLKIGRQADPDKLPRIFYVNWFRKDSDGRFLWPGFGENIRILKWVFERVDDQAAQVETPLGRMPTAEAIDTTGLDLSQEVMDQLLKVEVEGDGFDTLGGFVYHRLGKIPSTGDVVEYDGLKIEIVSTAGRRLKQLRVTRTSASP